MVVLLNRAFIRDIIRKMSRSAFDNLVPSSVRGVTKLDPVKFQHSVTIPMLKAKVEDIAKLLKYTKPYLLKLENFKPIQCSEEDPSLKCIHLSPFKVKTWTDISEDVRTQLFSLGLTENDFQHKPVEFSYKNYKYEQIFKAVLPENEDTVSGYSQIGHIIHLNLRDHLLDYRHLIGQVLIDKIKTCRTVVNKSNVIDNTYRNFKMELIGGEEDYLVTVKENTCTFTFDFSKVYWNPRLGKEHERILSFLKPGDVLFDVFCGVGPFAVPAAKRKTIVYANDLNPDSYKWLNHNAKANKAVPMLKSFNLDGKDFIETVFKKYLIDYCNGKEKLCEKAKIYVTMNLPAMAVQFLKYFHGLLDDKELYDKLKCDVTVFVYCFVIGDSESAIKQGAIDLVIENIGSDVSANIVDVFNVRNVAPMKEMMRVTLKLTSDVLFSKEKDHVEPPLKKLCVK